MTSAEFSAPVVWQFLLTVAGAAAAAMQFVALRRERRAATLSAWNAGPAQILLFVAVCLFCFLGVGFVCAAAARELFPDANPQENLLLLVPAAQALSLAALLGFTKIFPEAFPPRFDAPPERRAGLRALVAGRFGVPAFFAAGIFVVTVGAALTSAAVALFPENVREIFEEKQMLVDALISAENPLAAALCVPAIVVFTPILEEIVFRAGLYRFLKSKMAAVPAAALSSAVFALMHDAPASYLPLALLGCVFCLAYEKTGRLAAPVLIHALFNANSLVGIAFLAP